MAPIDDRVDSVVSLQPQNTSRLPAFQSINFTEERDAYAAEVARATTRAEVREAKEAFDAAVAASQQRRYAAVAQAQQTRDEEIGKIESEFNDAVRHQSGLEATVNNGKGDLGNYAFAEALGDSPEPFAEPDVEMSSSEPISVSVCTIIGETLDIPLLFANMTLRGFYETVALQANLPLFAINLMLGERLLNDLPSTTTLAQAGIDDGCELSLSKTWGWGKPDMQVLQELNRRLSGLRSV